MTKCDHGHELNAQETKFYAGVPGNSGIFGEVLCDYCSNGSSQDGMDAGFLGWKEPSQQQIEQFIQERETILQERERRSH